jgi:DNA-binding transcriptional regulator GbsR (MarR family)
MDLTPAMRRFIDHFGTLGSRWGLREETCRAHALLYLAGGRMALAEIARGLGRCETATREALADLVLWGMARSAEDGTWDAGGEPWDLLFAALEERRRRELPPALEMLHACRDEAAADGTTPGAVRGRIARMLDLVEDLAALELQSRRLSSTSLMRLVSLGGRAARLLDRAFPSLTPPSRRT